MGSRRKVDENKKKDLGFEEAEEEGKRKMR